MRTREEILAEYTEADQKADALRAELTRLDALERKVEIDKYIGTYIKGDWEVSRIDRYDYTDTRFYGTTIYYFSDGNMQVMFNNTIFNPEEYTEATKEEFDAQITKVRILLEKE